MIAVATLFCLDTSFFINGWRKHYRIDVFPTIWKTLDELSAARSVMSCQEVFEELAKQHDELCAWAKERKGVFQKPTGEVISHFRKVMEKHPNFAAQGGSINGADPWIIAHAMEAGAAVVTDESPAPKDRPKKATKPPKIPDVCDFWGIPWVSPIDFLARAQIKL